MTRCNQLGFFGEKTFLANLNKELNLKHILTRIYWKCDWTDLKMMHYESMSYKPTNSIKLQSTSAQGKITTTS